MLVKKNYNIDKNILVGENYFDLAILIIISVLAKIDTYCVRKINYNSSDQY